MKPKDFVSFFRQQRASAILRTDIADAAAPAMEAAIAGGFRIVEFTMTIPGVLERIEEFSRRDDLVVGAGTVLTEEQARDAVQAGASFLVSPVVSPAVISKRWRRVYARLSRRTISPTAFAPLRIWERS